MAHDTSATDFQSFDQAFESRMSWAARMGAARGWPIDSLAGGNGADGRHGFFQRRSRGKRCSTHHDRDNVDVTVGKGL